MRSGSIQQFFTDYGSKTNFDWGFIYFQGSTATPLITDHAGDPIFGPAADMSNAITLFNSVVDEGYTPYRAALAMASNAISNDPDLNSTLKPKYILVFMSDGQPTDYSDDSNGLAEIDSAT